MFVYHNSAFTPWFLALWALFPVVFFIGWRIRDRFSFHRHVTRWINRLANRPAIAMATLFLVVLGANFLLACIHYPQPKIHDEFAYQLAADTYASGRLTNPTHPHWEHFETFHVLSQPTYMAKYPPGSGLVLGCAQWLTGHSIAGFWVTLAAGVAAMFWMLKCWIPARWALIGCLLIAINPYWLTNWGQTWWGGAVPFLAGSLLFGSMKRLVDRIENLSVVDAILYSSIFSVAASILAISRPFEGLIACAICVGVLINQLRRRRTNFVQRTIPLLLPAIVIGAAASSFIAWNNQAVTGDLTKLPYALHSQRYSASTMWLFHEAPPIPDYRLPRMREYYVNWSRQRHMNAQSLQGYLELAPQKLKHCFTFYPLFGGICLLPLIFFRRREDAWLRLCVLVAGSVVGLHLLTTFSSVFPHYVAPFACLFYVLVFHGLRCWRIAARWDRLAAYVLPAVLSWTLWRFAFLIVFTFCQAGTATPRTAVERQLNDVGGQHLVFVEYPEGYSPHGEWVFNKADIDNSSIVWAHSLSEHQNQALIEYFQRQDRSIWKWNAISSPTRLNRDSGNAETAK